jgi:hypothetical protein
VEPGDGHRHVVVSVGAGEDMTEELAVEDLGDGRYRLLLPPALTYGLAAGDVFEIDAEMLRPNVVRRSGNLTVWLYAAEAVAEARGLAAEVEALGGVLDGSVPGDRIFIFTLPVAASFPAVDAVFEGFVEHHPSAEWRYGNVYADDGVTPLGWWE